MKKFPDNIYVTESATNDENENLVAWRDKDLAIEDACADGDERVAVYELVEIKKGKVERSLRELDN